MLIPLIVTSAAMSSLFAQMSHPMALGVTLLVQTTIISAITGMVMKSFWFSYILFLIFMGGMLVLFIYVASLSPNEMFSLTNPTIMIMTIMTLATAMLVMTDPTMISMSQTSLDTPSADMAETPKTSIAKIYSPTISTLTSLLIAYLFLTLIAVVKITDLSLGPLRMKK